MSKMVVFDMQQYEVKKDRENKLYVAANELEKLLAAALIENEVKHPMELIRRETIKENYKGEFVRVHIKSSEYFPIFEMSYDLELSAMGGFNVISLEYAGKGRPSDGYMRTIDNATDFFRIYGQTTMLKAVDDAVRAYDGDVFKLHLDDYRDRKPDEHKDAKFVIDLEPIKMMR